MSKKLAVLAAFLCRPWLVISSVKRGREPAESVSPESYMAFNAKKAAQVVAFFARERGGAIAVIDVSKLVYLADRDFLERYGITILDDEFVQMAHGPVCTSTYDLMKGNAAPRSLESWNTFVSRTGNKIMPVRALEDEDFDEVSDAELETLYGIIDRFKDVKDFDLVKWVHDNCREWKNPGKTSVPLTLEEVFGELKKPDPDRNGKRVRSLRRLGR